MLVRADQLLVKRGLVSSRTVGQRLIRSGQVAARDAQGNRLSVNAATRLAADATVEVLDPGPQYASRGALKLAGALDNFAVRVNEKVCLDAGQSSGGFTDILLSRGASRVVGLDVGHGQLVARLRSDPRVVCVERINVRDCTRELLAAAVASTAAGRPGFELNGLAKYGFDCVVADLSFISLRKVLPALKSLLAPDGDLVALVKPQFELGPNAVNKRGIVRNPLDARALQATYETVCMSLGLKLLNWMDSPITGGSGNHEFLMHAKHETYGR